MYGGVSQAFDWPCGRTGNDQNRQAFACIVDDMPALLGCGSALFQPFFEVLMPFPAAPELPYFITLSSDLPLSPCQTFA